MFQEAFHESPTKPEESISRHFIVKEAYLEYAKSMILQEHQICSICNVPKCIQRQNNFGLRSADPNKVYLNRKAFGSVTHTGNILHQLQQRLLFFQTYD